MVGHWHTGPWWWYAWWWNRHSTRFSHAGWSGSEGILRDLSRFERGRCGVNQILGLFLAKEDQ
jgi:hypothetical protein